MGGNLATVDFIFRGRALLVGLVVCALVLLGARPAFAQCASLTTVGAPYTQDFDTLSNTAGSTTNQLVITGWFLTETGGGARDNEQYAVDTGGSTTGDIYSYGAAATTDRALGGLRSGTLIPIFGGCFTNNTGTTVTSLAIAYTGEQWRLGTAARTDQINFEYSTSATSLNSGTWTGVAALNFVTPDTATIGLKNGNAAPDRTALSSTVPSLSIANGATFWIRWTEIDATGADDGLAVDDFSLTPQAAVATTLSIGDVSANEGNAATATFTFTVSLSAPAPAGGVTFDIATADGTAVAPSDYVARSLTGQTIPAGSTTYVFDVAVNGDVTYETDEAFLVNVTNVTNATASDEQGAGTITNDDLPSLTIADFSANEGNAATATFTFTVSLSAPAPAGGVTFDIATADGTADVATSDYVVRSLTGQTILAGNTTYTFDVAVNGDVTHEADETFLVNVTNVTNASVVDGQGVGTITNDDPFPSLTIGDVAAIEGNGTTTPFTFTVSLSAPAPAGGVTFDIATADGTAGVATSDYLARSLATQTIPAGGTLYTFDVAVNGDTAYEADETFLVNVTNLTNAALADGQGVGTITNDDPLPTLGIDDVTASEGNAGTTSFTFTVSLSAPAPAGGVTFDIATADGAASVSTSDYQARALTGQTIQAGNMTYSFVVAVNGDTTYEPGETFFVNVTGVTGATAADGQGLGTISNDDAQPCVEGVTCASGNYCDPSNACVPQRGTGQSCNPATDCKNLGTCVLCQSGNCVDGVCCDTPCSGGCAACSAARKGTGVDGACEPITGGTDPDGECAQDSQQSCGLDGTCDGAGACARYGAAITCGGDVCVGSESRPQRCNGLGACVTASSGTGCGLFVCSASSGQCLSSCSGPADCVSTHYCDTGTSQCVLQIATGSPCQSAGQCQSGFCVDNVCCSSGCGSTCVACSAAKKGYGQDGACAPVRAGSDPDDECERESQRSCGGIGVCNGAGVCAFWPVGTDCAATPGANTCVGNRAVGTVCTGPNTCGNAPTGTECTPQRCVAGACAPCSTAGDCTDPPVQFCDGAGVCQPKKGQGGTCAGPVECTSGNCVDGVCCESACSGVCEWCADPASPGSCRVAPAGQPVFGRACVAGGGTGTVDACALACDGQTRNACLHPPSGTLCAAASCSRDALVTASTCDGTGACVAGAPRDCGRYTCDPGTAACRTTCTQSSDCEAGSVCEVSRGTCAPPVADAGRNADATADAGRDADTPAPRDAGTDATVGPLDGSMIDTAMARPDTSIPDSGSMLDARDARTGVPPTGAEGCSCRMAGRPTNDRGGPMVVLFAIGAALCRRRHARRQRREHPPT